MRSFSQQQKRFHKPLKISLALGLGFWLVSANGFNNDPQSAIDDRLVLPPETTANVAENTLINEEKLEKQRELYKKAETAFKQNRFSEFKHLKDQLKDYPLHSYLEYRDLRRNLGQISLDQARSFLSSENGSVISERFRRALIRHYSSHQRWDDLVEIYAPQPSIRLQCKYLQAELKTGNAQLAFPKIEKLWLSSQSLPKSCDPVFKVWEDAGYKTNDLVWQRIKLAMSSGKTRLSQYLAKSLDDSDRKWVNMWIKLYRQPHLAEKYKLLTKTHPMASTIRTHAIKRLSKKDPEKAVELWLSLKDQYHFNQEETNNVYKSIGLAMAREHYPEAHIWLNRIDAPYTTKYIREWHIRSAIRQGDWGKTVSAIEALPAREQAELRWQFWWAYANEELGNSIDAEGIYRYLAGRRSYYGFLAADRLNLPYAFENRPLEIDESELVSIKQYPETMRAQELFKLGKIIDARREWNQLLISLSNRQKLAASKVAQNWDWHDRAIYTMGKTDYRDDIALRFPVPMKEKIESWSQKHSIDTAWTYAIIRRESAFMSDAKSSVGALGLMQIMPRTARHVARNMKVRYRGNRSLLKTDTNLKLGTNYLEQMLNRLDEQHVLATAAYNAGIHRVKAWLPETRPMDAIRWVETIPFEETREYVSNVLAYTIIYQHVMNDEYTRLSNRMPPVPAKNPVTQTAQNDASKGNNET